MVYPINRQIYRCKVRADPECPGWTVSHSSLDAHIGIHLLMNELSDIIHNLKSHIHTIHNNWICFREYYRNFWTALVFIAVFRIIEQINSRVCSVVSKQPYIIR